MGRELERRLIDDLVGKVHQFEHERVAVRLERGQVFLRPGHDFGDADLPRFAQGFAQQAIGMSPALIGSKSNVVNLMDVLQKSLEASKKRRSGASADSDEDTAAEAKPKKTTRRKSSAA